MSKDLNYYMSLSWTFELIRDSDEESWFIKVKELPCCMSQGYDPNDAINMIYDAMRMWLAIALIDGVTISEPSIK